MKANISLALATKIDMILSENYGSDPRKFLSFVPPTIQMSFDFDELVLTMDSDEDFDVNAIINNNSNFAYMSNLIPEDNVMFQDKDGLLLWDQFQKIISNSITANMILSAEDQAKLKNAKTFLEDNYANYHKFKKIYLQTKMNYVDAKISMESSTGEEKEKLENEWNDGLKAILEESIQSAENDLKVLGKRTEIEQKLQTISAIETKKGIGNLKAEISSELDLFQKSNDQIEYFPTLYAPNNIFEKKSEWSSIMLYSSEITSLCENAKPELKKSYTGNDSGDNIEYLSFEYAVVSIVRPWFFEDFLNSTSFKLNGILEGPINDGKIPANGMIPSYINKFICIKKIEYKLKKDTTVPKAFTLPIISVLPLQQFNISAIQQVQSSQLVKSGLRKKLAKLKLRTLSSPDKRLSKVRDHRTKGISKVRDHRAKSILKVTDQRTKKKLVANNHKLFLWNKKHIATVARPKAKPTIFKPIDDKHVDKLVEEELDGITIVAFECKRLNLSPNPNMDLDWI